MKPLHLNVAAKSSLASEAADYINRLAAANGFTTATNEAELHQYNHWFVCQANECDEYIASKLVIEISPEEIEKCES